jgi:hypothetical protein
MRYFPMLICKFLAENQSRKVSPLLVAAMRALLLEAHADEAVENFPVLQIFHCAPSLLCPRDSTTGGS